MIFFSRYTTFKIFIYCPPFKKGGANMNTTFDGKIKIKTVRNPFLLSIVISYIFIAYKKLFYFREKIAVQHLPPIFFFDKNHIFKIFFGLIPLISSNKYFRKFLTKSYGKKKCP